MSLHQAPPREPERFGDWLRQLRQATGQSMAKVARALGVSVVEVSCVEVGTGQLARGEVQKWASAYGVDHAAALATFDRFAPRGRQVTCPKCHHEFSPEKP